MRPPASLDGLPGDRVDEARDGTARRHEDDAVPADEGKGLRGGHFRLTRDDRFYGESTGSRCQATPSESSGIPGNGRAREARCDRVVGVPRLGDPPEGVPCRAVSQSLVAATSTYFRLAWPLPM